MKLTTRQLVRKVVAMTTLFCMTTQGTFARYLDLADVPLFIGANVPPQVMLTISKDQQLYKKAYNDYSDLDGDGALETTYKHGIDYYGYFDSYKCYEYKTATQLFEPVTLGNNRDNTLPDNPASAANLAAKYCTPNTGQWSGNFLNWISMSRMDTVRRLLYGGMRSTDTTAGTVLERAHFPTDAHAWAKYYPGRTDPATGAVIENDIGKLTPFNNVPVKPNTAAPPRTTSLTGDRCTSKRDFFQSLGGIFSNPLTLDIVAPFTPFCNDPVPTYTVAPLPFTPFTIPNLLPSSNSFKDENIGFTSAVRNDPDNPISEGDQLLFEDPGSPGISFKGVVLSFPSVTASTQVVRVRIHSGGIASGAAGVIVPDLKITNLSRTGISFCNATIPVSANLTSQTNQDPPLIRVAQGNFHLWNANERYQCYWRNEVSQGITKSNQLNSGPNSNGNQAALSDIVASAENPSRPEHALNIPGITTGDYVARVMACKPGYFGTERCKQYPAGNYKPIGLLQEYGDVDLIQFGLMTGSYRKNISGGVLRKNIGTFTDEVDVTGNGAFRLGAAPLPATPPGSPRTVNSVPTYDGQPVTSGGIVSALNYMKIYGYNYTTGDYVGVAGDTCPFQRTNINENSCTSWGNPMAEIFFESLRYFAGNVPTPAFTFDNVGSKDNLLGLPLPQWKDPLDVNNYCSPINVLVFNASVSTNDDDLRDTIASGINSTQTAAQLTNTVGKAEGISVPGNQYFLGKLVGASATPVGNPDFEICTPKNIPGLGDVSGICPEGPTLAGSYLMPGLAHHARTNRIRTNIDIPTSDAKSLKVTTYGIQLATNTPQLTIAVPGSTTGQKVLIQPIYRLIQEPGSVATCPAAGPQCLGGGALVDLKFIPEKTTTTGSISTGKVYLNWDDSEQGGDYDQDMWGTLEWRLDAVAQTITITTTTIAASTNNKQGFGYTISGTRQDGPHFHSGILGFNYTDPTGVPGCTNCQVLGAGVGQRGQQTVTYRLGTSTAKTLEDPLWYASKYGSFIDSNGNGVPDLKEEWDSKFSNGQQAPVRPLFPEGGDGTPDTYFLVTNPLGLVAALDRAFIAILSNASASSVATNSTSLQSDTTIYQARFNANDWSGQVLAFGVDAQGTIATNPTWDAGQIVNNQDPLSPAAPAATLPSLSVGAIKGSGRAIITVNDARAGVPFRWPANPLSLQTTDIGKTLVDGLNLGTSGNPAAVDNRGQERLNYLRGSQASEGAGVLGFRVRPISRLGDIVNSNPNFSGPPNAGFGEDSYRKFREDNSNRQTMIYVGGNDGMLHAFRADDGRELLGYVPSTVHKKLNRLTDKTYVGNQHRYYVDGSPEIGDAFINVGGVKGWHTVLVGALGGGGQGLFALDVTRPDQFSESNAANIALWEFTDKDDPDLGFIYAQPTIRKMANGKFAAIVPGGYNQSKPETGETTCTDSAGKDPTGCTTSSTGSAYLFIIFLDGPGTDGVWDEGIDYVKIRAARSGDTPNTPNGLTQPLAADIDADGFVDFIYAGDLRGNLWKFDVRLPAAASPLPPVPNTSAPVSTWSSGDNRLILFVARDPETNKRQPITGKPEATLHPTGTGFIVTFGTGKYLERNDPYPPSGPPPTPATPYQTQSFYGIWDKNDARPIAKASVDENLAPAPRQTVVTNRSQLLPHEIKTAEGNDAIRVVVALAGKPETPDWSKDDTPPDANDSPDKDMGWLLDFPKSTATGERSVFRPILTAGRLIFSTLLPLTQSCQFGGTSFTMVIDPTTGGRIDGPVLDTDANGLLNSKDMVSFGGKDIYASGVQSTIGITPTPTIIRAGSLPPDSNSAGSKLLGTSGPLVAASGVLLAYALAAGSSGGNASTMIGLSAAGGRVSWIELTAD